MTPEQLDKALRALATKIMKQAAEFAADPQKGFDAGYTP
jgi:hypothetical protein